MCVNKLYIKNNKLDFNPTLDRFFNYIPCGQCEECLSQQRNGYVLRLLQEFKEATTTYYITLTYDNLNLPKVDHVSCFDKNHVVNFFKRLRNYYPHTLKYFISSEYGDSKQRPHYHTIIYLYDSFSPVDFKKMVQKAWYYGNVYFGLNNGIVTNINPFNYCTKYITKDLSVVSLHDDLPTSVLEKFVNLEKVGLCLFPFHFQSTGLGLKFCDSLTDLDLIRGYVVYTNSDGLVKKYPVPLYAYRKCLYTTYKNSNGNISYKLNFRGQKLFKSRLLEQYKRYSEIYESFIKSSIFIESDINKSFIDNDVYKTYDFFVRWVLLYRDNDFIMFDYSSFSLDIDIYIHSIANNIFDITPAYHQLFDDSLHDYLNLFNDFMVFFKFQNYEQNQNAYNLKQYFRYLQTGKLKPVYVKTKSEYINQNSSHKCLTTYKILKQILQAPLLVA